MKRVLLSLLFCIALTSASTINFNFDTITNSSQESVGIIYSNSIVLQITTPISVLCRYSQTKGIQFNSMEGYFEDNFETIHKKTLTELSNGVYKYYVKCRPIGQENNVSAGTAELEATFKISNPISAQISMENSPLKAGKYEITLQTTKVPASTPLLKYSFDGITYTPIPLHGSENSWKGFLVISSSTGEEIGSFKFEAKDLEGRSGSQIYGNSIFIVDTKAPSTITSLEAKGEYGQIELKWSLDEDEEIEEIKIYKSETPSVGEADLYKTLDGNEEDYTDTDTDKGKTYYYRIAPIDQAGNMADLSREVSATSLLSKTSSSSGLSLSLYGLVDSLLSEINLLETDIESSENMIKNLDESKKKNAEILKITSGIQAAKSELTNLKRTVQNYKETDMTKEVLEGQLGSSRVKLNIIKKKVPETFSVKDSSEIIFNPTENSIRETLLEYSSELTQKTIDDMVEISLETTEKDKLKIKSQINILEITYLDGTRQIQSIINHFIESELEEPNSKLILKLPSGSLDLNSLSIKNLDYSTEQEGLITFQPDTKEITYALNQEIDPQILKEISISLIKNPEESTPLTGYFLSEIPTSGSGLAVVLILIASGLIGYLLFIKQQQKKEISAEFIKKAKEVKSLQKAGKEKEANELYEKLKIEYMALSEDQKHEVFKKIKHLTKP